MAGNIADKAKKREAKQKEFEKFADGGGEKSPAPPEPARRPKEKTKVKKYVGYYLPPDLVKWVKLAAVEADCQPSHLIQRILTEARAKDRKG